MKKSLVALFTLVALAFGTQSFAACCNNGCLSNYYYPHSSSPCGCACPVAKPCCPVVAEPCPACPITSNCNSCCDNCNKCDCGCREKCSWWKIFQNKNCCYKCNKCNDCCD